MNLWEQQPWGPRLETWWQELRRRLLSGGYSWTRADEERLKARIERLKQGRER